MFVDRQKELAFLNSMLTRKRPGPAQLILMYGRRRVGKSELLLHWAEQSGLEYTYWEAVKENANQQRAHLLWKITERASNRCSQSIGPGLTCGTRLRLNCLGSGGS